MHYLEIMQCWNGASATIRHRFLLGLDPQHTHYGELFSVSKLGEMPGFTLVNLCNKNRYNCEIKLQQGTLIQLSQINLLLSGIQSHWQTDR